ncbi:DEAD-domain-containing protein [Microstroma glucosiphilum]|uniref:ATP-dependent RNA helicase n=1 Tax=Pseudomicrostroma glucosiphilum TaxID=1684307 RepID=A0A316U7X4_9BASI|nr:DEAD-domain-containing protein [Pseudomicrostroma glucosiphilum]PWN21262.1 DEAD-domain-containing protein [Pseudomicrostroma glucosiphilum]
MMTAQSMLRSSTRTLRLALRAPSTSTPLSASSSQLPSLRSLSKSTGPTSVSPIFSQRSALPSSSRISGISRSFSSSSCRLTPSLPRDGEDLQEEEEAAPAQEDESTKFSSLKKVLHPKTYQALTGSPFNYESMSDVQVAVLGQLSDEVAERYRESAEKSPTDLLVKAKTGTGKTLAFLVPALETRLRAIEAAENGFFSRAVLKTFKDLAEKGGDPDFSRMDKAERRRFASRVFQSQTVGTLILSPTRELAAQIAREAEKLASIHRGINVHLLVGGDSKRTQLSELHARTKDIIVATPGRINDILNDSAALRTAMSCAETFVLDEADTLLEMGFQTELERIQTFLPIKDQRRNFFFSATVSRDIQRVAAQTLDRSYKMIDCVPEGEVQVHERIPQYGHVVPPEEHMPRLLQLIAQDQLLHGSRSKVIVFCNTTKHTQLVAHARKPMSARIAPTAPTFQGLEIHAQLEQRQRSRVSDVFRRTRSASVLVTTDVSARGVDYPDVTRVIQLGSAKSRDTYIHRIGRTGRAGKEGIADLILLKDWEDGWPRFEGKEFPIKPVSHDAFKQELAQSWDSKAKDESSQTNLLTSADEGPLKAHILSEISERIAPAMMKADDNNEISALRGIYLSMIGFYVNQFQTFRVDKADVAHGLSEWAKGSLGLTDADVHLPTRIAEMFGLARSVRGGGSFSDRGKGGGRFGDRDGGGGRFGDREGGGSSRFGDSGSGGARGGYGSSRGGFGGSRDSGSIRPGFGAGRENPRGRTAGRPGYSGGGSAGYAARREAGAEPW